MNEQLRLQVLHNFLVFECNAREVSVHFINGVATHLLNSKSGPHTVEVMHDAKGRCEFFVVGIVEAAGDLG